MCIGCYSINICNPKHWSALPSTAKYGLKCTLRTQTSHIQLLPAACTKTTPKSGDRSLERRIHRMSRPFIAELTIEYRYVRVNRSNTRDQNYVPGCNCAYFRRFVVRFSIQTICNMCNWRCPRAN